MIEEPGCSATSSISPNPASGPEFIQRRSLEIFISEHASVFNWPDSSTAASCADMPSKKLPEGENFTPDLFDSSAQIARANFGSALMPVPTAVPPCGKRRMRFIESSMRSIAEPTCADHPDNSCPKV